MEQIKTQDVWVPVDVKERLPIKRKGAQYMVWLGRSDEYILATFTGDNWFYKDTLGVIRVTNYVTHWLEKHTDMVVLTPYNLKKIVTLALTYGGDFTGESGQSWSDYKKEYLNQLIK